MKVIVLKTKMKFESFNEINANDKVLMEFRKDIERIF